MKKRIARIVLVFFILINLLPLTALAEGNSAPPESPYEKIAAKSGKWYAEQFTNNGKSNLVIGYTGSWKSGGSSAIDFKIKEETVLTGIYLPVIESGEGEVAFYLTDSKGNRYSGFSVDKQIEKPDEQKSPVQDAAAQDAAAPEAADQAIPEDVAISITYNATWILTPKSGMTLPEGNYTLTAEGTAGLTGDFLVKGFYGEAYDKYKKDLLNWELANKPEQSPEAAEKVIGEQALGKDDGAEPEYGVPVEWAPPSFELDGEYQIDEIIISTFNDGQGALPGTISVIGENGQTYYSGQSYGATIDNIANAAWKIAPSIILPAGKYTISVSQPEFVTYDQKGEPLFFVKASIPVKLRPDYTGTYRIDLDAVKTSTLMGPVTEQVSSFSLKDFELTVLDKDGEIELIGKYEKMPFSQSCEIIEETTEGVAAKFNFTADLSKLPYKAKIAAEAVVTLSMGEDGTPQIAIAGTGVFDRAASKDKGADYNTYDIKASGVMANKELPPFVMTALGKAGSAGNIPGPDNATQAAAGILFPPLVGLVVSVLQDALKPKEPVKSKKTVRDKAWYAAQYPGKSDNELGMIMMADAMGNTDEPDEGDAESVGDNEYSGTQQTESEPEPEYEPETSAEQEQTEPPQQEQPEPPYQEEQPQPESKEEEPPAPEQEQPGQEPETMVLKTSANGAESLYVKDPETGQWVNAETGGVLDLEKYPEAMDQMQATKEWSEAREEEIQSRGGSEHDKELRKNMEEIRRKEEQEAYENKLRKKYGIDDLDKIEEIVKDRKERAEEWAETWRRNEKILGAMEVGAVAVGTAADVGVEGLSKIVPGGTAIKAGYKVVKGVAGTMAEAGAKGKDPFTLANIAEGGIKGVADAALDKMPGGDGLVGETLSAIGKGALTMAGEGAGAGAGAALRGEDVGEAINKGLKDGAYKAAVGLVTDKVAGDLPAPIMSKGTFKAVPNLKNVIVSKAAGTKLASAFADEYAVKPVVMGK
jgi:hypothetical protein